MAIFLLLLFAVTTASNPLHSQVMQCESIEINRYHQRGTLVLSQAIFWDRYRRLDGLHVRDYVLLRDDRMPIFDHARQLYVFSFWCEGRLIEVLGRSVKYTSTDYDPEQEDKAVLFTANRRPMWHRYLPQQRFP